MEEKKKRERNSKGQFVKGNTAGSKTQFAPDNDMSLKYKEEYCDKLIEFFSQPSTRTEYKKTYFKGELTSEEPIELPNDYPTFEAFAASIGVTHKTLRIWCEKYRRFSDCYARAKELQLSKLTTNALTGMYNPNYAKFEAINNHGLREKQEVQTNVSGSVDIGLDDKTLALIERVGKRLNDDGKDGK